MAADDIDPIVGSYRIALPNGSDAPKVARRYLAEHASWLAGDVLADALLIVSELVTNAIRYGRPDIVLSLRADPPRVGVAVDDAGGDLPVLADSPPDPTAITGRGLRLVDALADDWGVVPHESNPGKTVWFELGHANRGQARQ